MVTFTTSIRIDKPVEIIASALMNPDNFPYWQTNLVKFEVVTLQSGMVGSIGRLHYSQKGRSYVLEDTLIYCEPRKKYVSHVTGDLIDAHVETTLDSFGTGTDMRITWSGRGNNVLLKLLLVFTRNKMIRQTRAELETFKTLVETKGEKFGEQPVE